MSEQQLQDFIPSLAEMPPQHAEWLVDGFIHQGVVTMISGEAGSGKTTWALAMAGAVSQGIPFAGLKTTKAPVLYLDKENPQIVAQQKILSQRTPTGPDFLYWGMWVNPEPTSMYDTRITDYVKACDPKPLIIVDSLAAFYGGDENEAVPIRKFFKPMSTLAAMGASIIVIHHTGKGENTKFFRGSQAIKDSITGAFLVENISKGQILERIKLKAWKTRVLLVDEQVFDYGDGRFSCYHGPAIKSVVKTDHLAKIGIHSSR